MKLGLDESQYGSLTHDIPTTWPRLLMAPNPVAGMAPRSFSSRPRSTMPPAGVQRNVCRAVHVSDPPTTSPRLFNPVPTLRELLPVGLRLPRSRGTPFSHRIAWGPKANGKPGVLSQVPEDPATWPRSLIASANPTVSLPIGGSA